jgi:hypothetical protein
MGVNTNSGTGCIFALNAYTGALVWNFTYVVGSFNNHSFDDYIVQCPVAVQNGIAYFASGAGVYAVNAKTGHTKWHYIMPDYLANSSGSISVAEGYVFASVGSQLFCLKALNGQGVWNTTTNGFPAVANGMVIVGGIAYRVSSGEKLWSIDKNGLSVPAIANGAVYYGHYFKINDGSRDDNFKHELLGVNASTGQIFWTYTLPNITAYQFTGNLAIAHQSLYDSELFQVLAFDLTSNPPTATPTPTQKEDSAPTLDLTILVIVVGIVVTAICIWQIKRTTKSKSK